MKNSGTFLKYALNALILLGFLVLPFTLLAAGSPLASTQPASYIRENYANLSGFFDPNGDIYTSMWLEYGVSSSNLDRSLNLTPSGFSGSQAKQRSGRASDLDKNTFYYFRACAQNTFGTDCGLTYSFKTGPNPVSNTSPTNSTTQTQTTTTQTQPQTTTGTFYPNYGYTAPSVGIAQPRAVTYAPVSVTENSAILKGALVLTSDLPTDAWFEWGENISLGNKTGSRELATGIGSYNFEEKIAGLEKDSVYYVQAVVKNANGTSRGTAFSFKTLAEATAPAVAPVAELSPSPAPQPSTETEETPEEKDEAAGDAETAVGSGAAGVFFSGLFPDSVMGWLLGLFLLILAFLAGWHTRRIYERNLREKVAQEHGKKLRDLEAKLPT